MSQFAQNVLNRARQQNAPVNSGRQRRPVQARVASRVVAMQRPMANGKSQFAAGVLRNAAVRESLRLIAHREISGIRHCSQKRAVIASSGLAGAIAALLESTIGQNGVTDPCVTPGDIADCAGSCDDEGKCVDCCNNNWPGYGNHEKYDACVVRCTDKWGTPEPPENPPSPPDLCKLPGGTNDCAANCRYPRQCWACCNSNWPSPGDQNEYKDCAKRCKDHKWKQANLRV